MLGVDAYEGIQEEYGFWGENITVEGLDLSELKPMDCLYSEEVALRVTITARTVKSDKLLRFSQGGPKDIPRGGLFVHPHNECKLRPGLILRWKPKVFKIRVLTLSDRASEGIYEDKSGELALDLSREFFDSAGRKSSSDKFIIPDEKDALEQHFQRALDERVDILITTGGTGIGKRDITPDVIKPLLEKEIPGIMELIRVKYGMEKPNALVSRSIAGVREKTLVYCLPGSSKGVREYMNEILPTVFHSLYMLHGIQLH